MFVRAMPRVLSRGRWWSADELDAIAQCWHAAARDALGERNPLVAAALPATHEGVALFVALSSLPSHLIVLVPDARAWRSKPPVPAGTPLVLPPSLASLGPAGRALGLVPFLLRDPGGGRRVDGPVVPLQGPGVVLFTSGSTDLPKPVFRPTPRLITWAMSRVGVLGLAHGAGILMGVPLATGQGLHNLLAAILLGRWGSSIRLTTGRCSRRSGRRRSSVGVPRPTSPISWAAALSAARRSPRGSAFCRARSPGSCTTPSSLASACRCGRRTRAPRPAW